MFEFTQSSGYIKVFFHCSFFLRQEKFQTIIYDDMCVL